MKTLALLLTSSALISPFALGDTYRSQVELGYQQVTPDSDLDSDDSADYNNSLAKFSYHFKDVDNTKGPIAEAAFLDKASRIMLSYKKADLEEANTLSAIDAQLIFADTFIIESFYAKEKFGEYGLGLGVYFSDNLNFVFSQSEHRETSLTDGNDYDISALSMKFQGYYPLSIGEMALAYKLHYAQLDHDKQFLRGQNYGATLNYYLNDRIGLGLYYNAEATTSSRDVSYKTSDNVQSVYVDWFIVESLNIKFEFSEHSGDFDEGEALTMSLGFRF